jgi:hypothetical protein
MGKEASKILVLRITMAPIASNPGARFEIDFWDQMPRCYRSGNFSDNDVHAKTPFSLYDFGLRQRKKLSP